MFLYEKRSRIVAWLFLSAFLMLLMAQPILADAKPKVAVKASPKKKDFPDFKDVVKEATAYSGFYKLWKKEEKLYCEVPVARFDKPFLFYFALARGVGSGMRLLGGTTLNGQGWLLVWKRVGKKKLHLVRRNTRIRATKGSPMEKAVSISFTDSVLAAAPIVSEKPDKKTVLVDLTPILLTDLVGLSESFKSTFKMPFRFDRSRSTWGKIKAFPKNLELQAHCTYSSVPYRSTGEVQDTRGVQIVLHYSLSELPKTGYKPRLADDRIGYFQVAIKDFSKTSTDGPMVHYISRWNLQKADAKAKLSPPKRPIIFHIERSVPHKWRPYIREGILEWNKAFRKIGFADAIEVRVQGDEETWDPEDVRYNTIRWITSPYTFAIGPSRKNPLTGEILDADILVDASWIRSHSKKYERFFGVGSDKDDKDKDPKKYLESLLTEDALLMEADQRPDCCQYCKGLAHQINMGLTSLATRKALEPGDWELDEFIGAALKHTIMHEVGHTLGLRHNFKASAYRTVEELHSDKLKKDDVMSTSVMDYLAINIAPKGKKQGQYYDDTIGPYDYWAITYGYKPLKAQDEAKELKKIAQRCREPQLAYATDEDYHPLHNRDLDPLANAWDLGKEPMLWAEARLGVIRFLFDGLADRVVKKGKPYYRARAAFTSLLREYRMLLGFIKRYIGGQYVSRHHYDGKNELRTFTLVSAKKQRKALELLTEHGLSCKYFNFPPELLNSLAPDWRDNWESPIWRQMRLDYPLHSQIEKVNLATLARLYNSAISRRLLDMEKKYEKGQEVFKLEELYSRLTTSCWSEVQKAAAKKERLGEINSYRRNVQRWQVRLLGMIILGEYGSQPDDARALAWHELRAIKAIVERAGNYVKKETSITTKSHLEETAARIDKMLAARLKLANY